MLLSAVSVLVVAQSSSEIPEGLMNNPVWLNVRNGSLYYASLNTPIYYKGADKSLARPDWKKHLKVRRFSSDAEVIAAADSWSDGQHSEIFLLAYKNYSLVAVACFLPGRAKDLSTPRYKRNIPLLLIGETRGSLSDT